MSLFHWLGALLAFIAFAVALRYGAALLLFLRYRFTPRDFTRIELAALPDLHDRIFALAAPVLEALGFRDPTFWQTQPMLRTRLPTATYFARYCHPETATWATVMLAEAPEHGWLYTVSYTTLFVDGDHRLTSDLRAHYFGPLGEALGFHDDYLGSVPAAWQAHQARLAARADVPRVVDLPRVLEIEQAQVRRMFDEPTARGMLALAHNGDYRLTLRGAWTYLRALLRGGKLELARKHRGGLEQGVAADDPQADALRASVDALAMRPGLLAATSPSLSVRATLCLLLVSGLLSFAAFAWVQDARYAALIMVVLGLHEGGHYLAMRRFDYSDLKVFFVPLLGAAVTGHRDRVPSWQQVVIFLAGPVPGLVLGLALLAMVVSGALPAHQYLVFFALLSIGVNYFNLLPLEILDGGRVVGLLLFARFPAARVVTVIASALAFMAMAHYAESSLPIFIGAGLLVAALPVWRNGRMLQALRGSLPPEADEPVLIQAACATLGTCEPRLNYTQRYATVKALLPALRTPLPPRRVIVAGMAAYLFLLALPPGLVWAFNWHGRHSLLPNAQSIRELAERSRWEDRLGHAATPDQQWVVLNEAATYFTQKKYNYTLATQYLQRAQAVASSFKPDDLRRVDTTLALADLSYDDQTANKLYASVLPVLTGNIAEIELRRAKALQGLHEHAAQDDAAALTWLAEALAILERRRAGDDPGLVALRSDYAKALLTQGDAATARDLLQRNLAAATLPLPSKVEGCADPREQRQREAATELAWLLIDQEQAAAAKDLLAPLVAQAAIAKGPLREDGQALLIAQAWAQFQNREVHEAIRSLETVHTEIKEAARSWDLERQLQVEVDLALFCQAVAREACVRRLRATITDTLARDEDEWLHDTMDDLVEHPAFGDALERTRRVREGIFLKTAGLMSQQAQTQQ